MSGVIPYIAYYGECAVRQKGHIMSDTPKMTLAELKAAMATFTAAELKAAVKDIAPVKHTMLSLTYDVAIEHDLSGKGCITDNIATDVTILAREHGLLGTNENADQAAIKTRLSFAKAYDAALGRAGLEIVRKGQRFVPVEAVGPGTGPLYELVVDEPAAPEPVVDNMPPAVIAAAGKPNGKQQHRPAA
jgi:hypothetical protein